MKFARMKTVLTLIAFSMVAMPPLQLTAQATQEKESSTTIFNFTLTVDAKIEIANAPAKTTPKQESTNDQLLVTYYVGDLVSPISNQSKASLFEKGEFNLSDQERAAIKAKDFVPIIDLIKSTIDSDSWEDQEAGSISPYIQNLSLVVSQTQSAHQKIQSLLQKLRELNDVMIKLDSHLVLVDESSSLSGESFDPTSSKNYKSMIQAVADNALASSTFPAAVLFNGELNTYPRSNVTASKLGPLHLQAVVTPDRKSVKLLCTNKEPPTVAGPVNGVTVSVKPNKKDKQEEDTAKTSQVVKIANEGYVSIDVTPMLENSSENQKAILFVRSTISDRSKKQQVSD